MKKGERWSAWQFGRGAGVSEGQGDLGRSDEVANKIGVVGSVLNRPKVDHLMHPDQSHRSR